MAGKRLFDESESDQDLPAEIRKRPRTSLRSVVGEVVMVNSLQNLFSYLEPLLRRVVNEEVENVLRSCTRSFSRSPSLQIQALEPSSLKLVFSRAIQLPIFTGSKIQDDQGNALRVHVVDRKSGHDVPVSLAHPVKVEIVVLDGDFPRTDGSWTSAQFDKSIVKERAGKRPLLHGDLVVTLKDGSAVVGDIEFTDNSSWIRCRKFRIGARLVPGSNSSQGLSVGEAMTEAFMVKDHRGELYKKHHPPQLDDDVWRLEKIGKDGAFHKKLAEEGIKTVQDFLKLSVIDPQKLRNTLGVGMSEKMWEVTLKHAMKCEMGNKRYIYGGNQMRVTLSPICQVIRAEINGVIYSVPDIHKNKSYFENLVRDAYDKWNTLQVEDTIMNETALLTQGEMMGQQQYPHHAHHHANDDKIAKTNRYFLPSNAHADGIDWTQMNTVYYYGPDTSNLTTISGSSSDGDLASQGL